MTTDVNTGAPGEQVIQNFQVNTAPPQLDSGESPLVDFWGTGCGWMVKGGTGRDRANADGTVTPGRPWQRIQFNWIGLEVLESNEPYPHPTATLSCFYSDPDRSYKARPGQGTNEWDAWCKPLRAMGLEGNPGLDKAFGGIVYQEGQQPASAGLRMHVKRVPTLVRVGPDTDAAAQAMAQGDAAEGKRLAGWHDAVRDLLTIVEIEGVGQYIPDETSMVQPTTPAVNTNGAAPVATPVMAAAAPEFNIIDYVLGLADGKTVDQFYQAALDDAQVMANPSLVTQMTGRSFHTTMVGLGKLTFNAATGLLGKA